MRRSRPVLAALCLLVVSAAVAQTATRPAPEGPTNRFGHERPLRKADGAIRIASYNVLNLFDQSDDPTLEGEFDDLAMATDDARCRAIAAAILATDADVLALQEIESLAALEWFRDTYLADAGYTYAASFDVGYYRGVECSLLSRFEITDAQVWPNQPLDDVARIGAGWDDVPADARPLTYQRSPLMVDVRHPDGYELTLFVLHHKSGRNYRYQREAEALRTVEKLRDRMERDPGRNIVVLGDFNAAPWDKSLRVYLEAGMIDTLAHRSTDRKNPESLLFATHESYRTIDFLLLNGAAHREFVVGSAHVFGTLYDAQYDWRNDPFPSGYAADHYPLMLDLVPRDRR